MVAACLLAVPLVACSGGGGGDDPSIESSLALIPARHDAADLVAVNLYDEAWAASGADRDATGKAFGRAAIALSARTDGAGALTSMLFRGVGRPATLSKTAGYAPGDLASDIRAGEPPHQLMAATGDIDKNAVYDAFTQHVQNAERRTLGDEKIVSWLEDGKIRPGMRTPYSLIGESGRVAVLGNELAYARTDADMTGMVQAAHGETETLADNDDLAAAAQALDDAGVYSAMLGTRTYSSHGADLGGDLDPAQVAKQHKQITALALTPYRAYGIGVTKTDDQATMVVVLVMDDHDGATRNAERLRAKVAEGSSVTGQPWSHLLSKPKVSVDDAVVTARFDVDNATLWYDIVPRRDTLLNVG